MSKTQVRRLMIVLFLLAALPGMTVVVAQGQEPAKVLPAGSVVPAGPADWGETAVTFGPGEVEPNNSKGTAMVMSITDPAEVVSGKLENGDVDWYKFYVPATPTGVLINTDAAMDGENTDTVVRLFDSSGATEPMLLNDDMDDFKHDSLLFAVLKTGWYYVSVMDHPAGGNCTVKCQYKMIITRPILISAAAAKLGAANIEGIPFRSEDILALHLLANDYADVPQHKWLLFFDGSDVGITKPLVNIGLGWVHGDGMGSLTLGFGANQPWQDWQGVNRIFKPWDWAQVGIERVGPNTLLRTDDNGYRAVEYHAGAEHGLTTAAEKVDAFDLNPEYGTNPPWRANVFMSTTGAAVVPTGAIGDFKAADEDVILSETWPDIYWWNGSLVFDGSKVKGLAAEDIYAVDYEASRDRIALTILGTGKVLNRTVTQKDIFFLDKLGSQWVWHTMIHLPDYGWNYNIDAIECGGN